MLNWRALSQAAPRGFDAMVSPVPDMIVDFENADQHLAPPDSYGPQHANQFITEKSWPSSTARTNVDSYVWLAATTFWRAKCGVVLRPSDDDHNGPECAQQLRVDVPVRDDPAADVASPPGSQRQRKRQ